jgi:hypothetical protein
VATASASVRVLEKCKNDRLLIRPGRNLWLLARTDKDAPTPADVVDTAGAFLLRALGRASPSGFDATEIIKDPEPPPGALAAWYIGAARPALVVYVGQQYPQNFREGQRLGRSMECDAVRLVQADRPWYLLVEFDWRGPETWASWPASKVSSLGIRSQDTRRTDLDWLAVEAFYQGPAELPDSTLGEQVGDYVEEKADKAIEAVGDLASKGSKTILIAAGVAVAVLLAYGFAKRSR